MKTGRDRCLALALDAVKSRSDAYGAPEALFERIAARWRLTLAGSLDPDHPLTGRHVALMMIDLKVERALAGNTEDSWVDIAGYAACGAEIDGSV